MWIEKRHSIRKYEERPVPKVLLEEPIKAASLAPSAKNRQPWKYLIYTGPVKEALLAHMQRGLEREKNGQSPYEPLSVDQRVTEICDSLSIGASVQNMLLKATELGLETLWIANTCFAYPELVDFIQTSHQLVGGVAVGYPRENPWPRPRKKLEEIYEYRE